jgi:hypothetical protein
MVTYSTKNRGVGYNVLWSYCTGAKQAEIENEIRETTPGATTIVDTFGNAMESTIALARRNPSTRFVYRVYNGDNVHRHKTPTEFVAQHAPFRNGPTNLFVELTNEPSRQPDFDAGLRWMLETMKLCRQNNIRVSFGAFSVGVPEVRPNYGDLPMLKEILIFAAKHLGWFVLSLHEYTEGLFTVDFAPHSKDPSQWPQTVGENIALHLMGRFREWINYCESLGIKCPPIVITEWGFDSIEAVEDRVYGANIGPLWKTVGLWQSWRYTDWEAYAAAQLKAAWKLIYQAYSDIVVGVCLFCRNDANEWADWNYDRAPRLVNLLKSGFDTMEVQVVTMIPKPLGFYTVNIKTSSTFINFRRLDGSDIGDVPNGATIEVLEDTFTTIRIDGTNYSCQKINFNGTVGYIARTTTYDLEPIQVNTDFVTRMRVIFDKIDDARQEGLRLLAEYELVN